MHFVPPVISERPWAQIFSRYSKYFGFSNSPTNCASCCAASACSSGSRPGAK